MYHSLIATQRFIAFLWRACSNVASPCGHEVCIEHRKSSGDSSGSSFEAQRASRLSVRRAKGKEVRHVGMCKQRRIILRRRYSLSELHQRSQRLQRLALVVAFLDMRQCCSD